MTEAKLYGHASDPANVLAITRKISTASDGEPVQDLIAAQVKLIAYSLAQVSGGHEAALMLNAEGVARLLAAETHQIWRKIYGTPSEDLAAPRH